ncbi:putative uncharacterized protein DDB_G0282133 isoform X1 [Hydra vulgaris]|uniref:putative uncharacterized protein DDB_G0282133 isoform X1 n=1 Tax=Hydra vulgaris TaxID=6087 RepID=UPI001F5E57BA|nr:putative uncharacterized protein DDB_G0282133 isoform X1 [Hydra vulgaris]
MASKKRPIDEARSRLTQKITEVQMKTKLIQDMVEKISNEAVLNATKVLELKSKKKFMNKYSASSQQLEASLNQLLVLSDTLESFGNDSSESDEKSSESEDDDKSFVSVATSFASQCNIFEKEGCSNKKSIQNENKSPCVDENKNVFSVSNLKKHGSEESVFSSVSTSCAAESSFFAESSPDKEKNEHSVLNLKRHDSVESIHSSVSGASTVTGAVENSVSNIQDKEKNEHMALNLKKHDSVESIHSSVTGAVEKSVLNTLNTDVDVKPFKWESNTVYPVIISNVKSPWNFNIQLANPENDIMEQLCLEFKKDAENGYRGGINYLPPNNVFCCVKSPDDGAWYRGKIVQVYAEEDEHGDIVLEDVSVKVYFIDEGNSSIVSLSSLRPLHKKFSKIPSHSFHCILGGVQPVEALKNTNLTFSKHKTDFYECEKLWSQEATNWFRETVKETIVAAFFGYPPENSYSPPNNISQTTLVCDLYINTNQNVNWWKSCSRPPIESNISFKMIEKKLASVCTYFSSELINQKLLVDKTDIAAKSTELPKTTNKKVSQYTVEISENVTATGNKYIFNSLKKDEDISNKNATCNLKTFPGKIKDQQIAVPNSTASNSNKSNFLKINYYSSSKNELNNDKKREPFGKVTEKKKKAKVETPSTRMINRFLGSGSNNVQVSINDKSSCISESNNSKTKELDDKQIENEKNKRAESAIHIFKTVTINSNNVDQINDNSNNITQLKENSNNINQVINKSDNIVQLKDNSNKIDQVKGSLNNVDQIVSFNNIDNVEDISNNIDQVKENNQRYEEVKNSSKNDLSIFKESVFIEKINRNNQLDIIATSCNSIDQISHEHSSTKNQKNLFTIEFSNNQPTESENVYVFGKEFLEKDLVKTDEDFIKVFVSHVVNPGKIYVHVITPEVCFFDERNLKLNEFYNANSDKIRKYKLQDPYSPNTAVVACLEDNQWYRAVVLTCFKTDGLYDVLCVDFGFVKSAAEENILPIVQQFCEFPMETVACCLADIQPLPSSITMQKKHVSNQKEEENDAYSYTSEQKTNSDWSEQSIFKLKSMIMNEILMASLKSPTKNSDGFYEIYLYDTKGDKDIFINQSLVDDGFVTSNVFHRNASQNNIQKEIDDEVVDLISESSEDFVMTSWNPMDEQYSSNKNAYSVDTDDPEVATLGFVNTGKKICYNFSRFGTCCYGENCWNLHVAPNDPKLNKTEVFSYEHVVDLPELGEWAAVTITSVLDPTHFWITFPYGLGIDGLYDNTCIPKTKTCGSLDALNALNKKINEYYSHSSRNYETDLTILAECELIASKFDDNCWYRSKVLSYADGVVQVLFVDYGNTAVVMERDTRKLHPEFLHLPFQAVECFLNNTMMSYKDFFNVDGLSHDEKLNLLRLKFAELYADKVLMAHIISRHSNNTLVVELYDTSTQIHTHINQFIRTWDGVVSTQRTTNKRNLDRILKEEATVNYIPG